MAESWVRLWAGATTDPKWQTIARKSGQPRYLVIALFAHLLMIANEAEERGDISALSIEDAASAMDCDEDQVLAVIEAMEGRVIEGGRLSGWEVRQPIREDSGNERTGAKSSTERTREFRKRQRERIETEGNDTKRCETQWNAPEADTEADINPISVVERSSEPTPLPPEPPPPTRKGSVCRMLRQAGVADAAPHHLTDENWNAILAKRTDEEILEFAKAKLASRPGQRTGLKYLAPGLLDDPQHIQPNARASPASPRKTKAEERAEMYAKLTGRRVGNEQVIANERVISGQYERIA